MTRTRTPRRVMKALWGILAIASSLGSIASGCGQDVATCASVSGLPGDATGFAASCSLMQDVCSTGSGGADLQAYLTCLGNAGTLDAVTGQCNSLYVLVNRECTGTGGRQPGNSGGGSGSTASETGTCAALSVCCTSVPAVTLASCNAIAAAGVQTSCASTLAEIEAAGYCAAGSGTSVTSGTGTSTVSVSVSAGNCAVGAACTQGEGCGLASAGPCNSNVTLLCDTDGVFVVSGFPCTPETGSCGWAGAGCSESCSCVNGQMVCTGNCPDAGLSMP